MSRAGSDGAPGGAGRPEAPGSGAGPAARGLAVEAVQVRFGALRAVDGVDLFLPPGRVLALLGPSGCGKSTLLRAVAGLQDLDAGRVTWDGRDLAPVPVHRRGFGLMFQDGQLFTHRDVAGNVAYGLRMARVPRTERDRRVAELLELVGLADAAHRRVETLSGGQRQRVALARALAPSPRLLLLDEPLSSLDRSLREHLAAEVARLLRVAGTTALLVTHDHDEAFTIADRVAVMDEGRILQTDEPLRLWRRPVDRRVARLLGYRWFVPGPPRTWALAPGALSLAALPDTPALRSAGDSAPPTLQGTVAGPPAPTPAGTVVSVAIPRVGTVPVAVEDPPPLGVVVAVRIDPHRAAPIDEP